MNFRKKKQKTCPGRRYGEDWYCGDVLKKLWMSAFIPSRFPYTNDTSTSVSLSVAGGEKHVSSPQQMLMRPVALDGSGACHEDEPPFNYEHKQSDFDEPCLNRMSWETNQA